MAAVNITISGVLCDKYGRTITPCTIVGSASLTGVGVGGGPLPGGPGETPPGEPPGIWGGPIDPYPDHGLPQPPNGPGKPPVDPPADGQSKPPPDQGGWGYWAGDGVDAWVLKPRPGVDPSPKQ